MRLLGVLMFLLGAAGTAYSTWSIYERKRPQDVAFALLAPVATLVMIAGLVVIFVPGFF